MLQLFNSMQFFTRFSSFQEFLFLNFYIASAQRLITMILGFYGIDAVLRGLKLNQFGSVYSLIADLSGLRNRYEPFGIDIKARVNDFVLGLEIVQNKEGKALLMSIQLRSPASRAY